jgi:hypothetical protein
MSRYTLTHRIFQTSVAARTRRHRATLSLSCHLSPNYGLHRTVVSVIVGA